MPAGSARKTDLCERLLELLTSGEFDAEASMLTANNTNGGTDKDFSVLTNDGGGIRATAVAKASNSVPTHIQQPNHRSGDFQHTIIPSSHQGLTATIGDISTLRVDHTTVNVASSAQSVVSTAYTIANNTNNNLSDSNDGAIQSDDDRHRHQPSVKVIHTATSSSSSSSS